MEISHFLYISLIRTHDIFCTFPGDIRNFTFQVHFLDKDTWRFLYISCGIRNLRCPAQLQDQGHMTFTIPFLYMSYGTRKFKFHVHFHNKNTWYFLYISYVLSEILCVLHISKIKDTWHLLYIYCGTRNFIFYYISNSRTHEWHFLWYYKIIISYFIFS